MPTMDVPQKKNGETSSAAESTCAAVDSTACCSANSIPSEAGRSVLPVIGFSSFGASFSSNETVHVTSMPVAKQLTSPSCVAVALPVPLALSLPLLALTVLLEASPPSCCPGGCAAASVHVRRCTGGKPCQDVCTVMGQHIV